MEEGLALQKFFFHVIVTDSKIRSALCLNIRANNTILGFETSLRASEEVGNDHLACSEMYDTSKLPNNDCEWKLLSSEI